ncbi:hypothetical protein [Hydrogenobaculum acidophilum]
MSKSLIDCVKEEIENFIKENRIKFLKIKNAPAPKDKEEKGKNQYKCEKWMTTELYFRFSDIFDRVVPEPGKREGDMFIQHKDECLFIEAKERFHGGGNANYIKDKNGLCKAIEEFINHNCKKFLFFSTYNEPIDEILKNKENKENKKNKKNKTTYKKFKDILDKQKSSKDICIKIINEMKSNEIADYPIEREIEIQGNNIEKN